MLLSVCGSRKPTQRALASATPRRMLSRLEFGLQSRQRSSPAKHLVTRPRLPCRPSRDEIPLSPSPSLRRLLRQAPGPDRTHAARGAAFEAFVPGPPRRLERELPKAAPTALAHASAGATFIHYIDSKEGKDACKVQLFFRGFTAF